MNNNPLVSVIIPVYNSSRYLKSMLDSVCGQNYRNIQIILIEDCSTDDSYDICEEYALKDERILLLKNEKNSGQSFSRNRAMDVANGDYYLFLDSDDVFEFNSLSKLVLEAYSNGLDILGFNSMVHDLNGKESKYAKFSYDNDVVSGESHLIRMLKHDQIYDVVWMYLYNADFIKREGFRFIENRIFEDEVWVPQTLSKAKRFMFVDMVAYHYFIRSSSTMTRRDTLLKKFYDKEKNCYDLFDLSMGFLKKNRVVFRDYLSRLYIAGVYYALESKQIKSVKINYRFIFSNVHTFGTFCKTVLFAVNHRLYFYLKNK